MNCKKIVNDLCKKCQTRDPFELAEYLNITVFYFPLGRLSGFYKYLKHHKCIFINSDLTDDSFTKLVMAHELGHAVLHAKENCYFMDNKTFLNSNKIEKEANQFAAELLIPDELILENRDLTAEQFARLTGYKQHVVEMRLKHHYEI